MMLSHQFRVFFRNLSSISYQKLNRQDPALSKLLISLSHSHKSNARIPDQKILVEGRRLIQDALIAGLRLEHLLFSKSEHLSQIEETFPVGKLNETQILKVPYSDLKLWSQMTTFSGMMGIFQKPNIENLHEIGADTALPITVICDNIREPNNLGSIIRTCAAIPCARVLTTRGCADPWDSKCLRGGAGGHFRVPVYSPLSWEDIVSKHLDQTEEICIADNNNAHGMPYTQINYTRGKHQVIVIGGETHGISAEAHQLCEKFKGNRIHIPMSNGMDSLNTASAISVILFDMKFKLNAINEI